MTEGEKEEQQFERVRSVVERVHVGKGVWGAGSIVFPETITFHEGRTDARIGQGREERRHGDMERVADIPLREGDKLERGARLQER